MKNGHIVGSDKIPPSSLLTGRSIFQFSLSTELCHHQRPGSSGEWWLERRSRNSIPGRRWEGGRGGGWRDGEMDSLRPPGASNEPTGSGFVKIFELRFHEVSDCCQHGFVCCGKAGVGSGDEDIRGGWWLGFIVRTRRCLDCGGAGADVFMTQFNLRANWIFVHPRGSPLCSYHHNNPPPSPLSGMRNNNRPCLNTFKLNHEIAVAVFPGWSR